MPTPTHDLIEEQILGSAATSVTFSSIPATYKDLVLEILQVDGSGGSNLSLQFNSDTGTNYSNTLLYGVPSGAGSGRYTNVTAIYNNSGGFAGTKTWYMQIQSYANTNVNKTVLQRMDDAGYSTNANAGLWRSTAAITSIKVTPAATNGLNTGSILRLWGISG